MSELFFLIQSKMVCLTLLEVGCFIANVRLICTISGLCQIGMMMIMKMMMMKIIIDMIIINTTIIFIYAQGFGWKSWVCLPQHCFF